MQRPFVQRTLVVLEISVFRSRPFPALYPDYSAATGAASGTSAAANRAASFSTA
jgi:hypothetical protein